jgi:FKBP-type peptidyl-prolyl cis-trans isomerase
MFKMILSTFFNIIDDPLATKLTCDEFMAQVEKKTDVYKLSSGLLLEKTKVSTKGRSPLPNDKCRVTYTGSFIDGSQFDANTSVFAPEDSGIHSF